MSWLLRLFRPLPRYHSRQYVATLSSSQWKALRAFCYARAGGRCEALFCRSRGPLELHHLHYRTLGRERPQDVRLLCKPHHRRADQRRVRRKIR